MARSRKTNRVGTYGTGNGIYIFDELRHSFAFRVLTPAARLVLIQFLAVYKNASRGDTEFPDDGMHFTYACCAGDFDSTTFNRARKQLCRVGFIKKAPELRELRPAAPDVYLPNTDWKRYQPTKDERARLDRARRRADTKLRKDKERRAAYRRSMRNGN